MDLLSNLMIDAPTAPKSKKENVEEEKMEVDEVL